MPTLGTADPNH